MAAPPTGDFLPGTKQNLEVPYNVIHDYDSTVTWGIYGFDGGPPIGTLETSVNNAGESSVSLHGMDGKNLTTMTYKSSGGAWMIEDAAGSPAATTVNTYPAGSTDEQSAISNLCRNVDVTSSCSFTPTSQDVNAYGAKPSELGVLYNSSSSNTQLTVGESESYSVTDTWGVTVSDQETLRALQLASREPTAARSPRPTPGAPRPNKTSPRCRRVSSGDSHPSSTTPGRSRSRSATPRSPPRVPPTACRTRPGRSSTCRRRSRVTPPTIPSRRPRRRRRRRRDEAHQS